MRLRKALINAGAILVAGAAFAAPATAALKRVTIFEALDTGAPSLIDVKKNEQLRVAPRDEKVGL